MKETEIKHVKWAVVGLLSLMFLTFAFRWVRNTWRENSSERRTEESRTVRIQNEPPSEDHPRIVSIHEHVWTQFKVPPDGPRKSFRCTRVDPNLWIEYMIDDDPNSVIVIPPRNHRAFRPMIVGSDSYGKAAKYDKVRIHPHANNPPVHDVEIFYVE